MVTWRPKWGKGEMIRDILSGKPYLVVHIFTLDMYESATGVIDLEDSSPTGLLIITQGNYDHYVRDIQLNRVKKGQGIKWEIVKHD